MEIRNLDDGSIGHVPTPRPTVQPLSPASAPLSEPLPDCIALPWPVNPPRQFPPITGPRYTVQPRVSVQSFVAAWAIIFGGLIAFLFLIAWIAS